MSCWDTANVIGRLVSRARRRIQSTSRSGREVLAHHAGGRELEHAGAGLGQRPAEAEELVLGRERAGHGLAVDGAVGDGA